jgi:hypothetical protein
VQIVDPGYTMSRHAVMPTASILVVVSVLDVAVAQGRHAVTVVTCGLRSGVRTAESR